MSCEQVKKERVASHEPPARERGPPVRSGWNRRRTNEPSGIVSGSRRRGLKARGPSEQSAVHVRPRRHRLRAGQVCEESECSEVRSASEVTIEHLMVNRAGFGELREQGHGRMQLQIIGRPHDLMRGPAVDREQGVAALRQARSQNGMNQERLRLAAGFNSVKPGRLAVSQAVELRKHEPHPVSFLSARTQFGDGLGEGAIVLRRDEALEVEGVRTHLSAGVQRNSLGANSAR